MKKFTAIFLLIASIFHSNEVYAEQHIYPSIPFHRGADLCQYKDTYGQSRTEYLGRMLDYAERILHLAFPDEILDLILEFDRLYDKNRRLAVENNYLDVTLESTFKSALDKLYHEHQPRVRKIKIKHPPELERVINNAKNGSRGPYPEGIFDTITYFAHGTYTLAPNCRGNIQVVMTLTGEDGDTISFESTAPPARVMRGIATQVFTHFQKTRFPNTLRIGRNEVTILGSINGPPRKIRNLNIAGQACDALDGHIPSRNELEMIDLFGDWDGGVSIGRSVWVVRQGGLKVYHPDLMNPSPVREPWEINEKEYYYYCIKN